MDNEPDDVIAAIDSSGGGKTQWVHTIRVFLPAAAHADFKARAERAGMTLTAWLVAAARERALRDSMAAYGEFVSEPEVAEQLAAFYEAGARPRPAP